MNVTFTPKGLDHYFTWQSLDRKTLKRINALIQSIQREGFMQGIGKPEKLKGREEYSRRIDEKNRLVYINDGNGNVVITSCKGHYED